MNVVVGITGGIAAYKAVGVVRALVLAGHDVHVVATENALRFVGRPTLEAISRNLVHTDLFDGVAEVRHVAIGQKADLVIVAPATANTIAKLATGLADDLLGTTILASTAPLVIAPAMHTEMWRHPSTVANVATLRERGAHIVGPDSGQLTGDDSGPGRMSEPGAIVAAALAVAGAREGSGDLVGRRILVTAGGTREPLDPVRFLGNRSSGKQGVAIARAAAERGADVVLVVANIDAGVLREGGEAFAVRHVSTTAELRDATHEEAATAEVVVMAAAVADYRPETVAEEKIKKEAHGDVLDLRLVRNPDILRELTAGRLDGQTIIGFAAETAEGAELLDLGRAKAARKGVDYLVLNKVGWADAFGADDNAVTIVTGAGDRVTEASGSKEVVAHRILDVLVPESPSGAPA